MQPHALAKKKRSIFYTYQWFALAPVAPLGRRRAAARVGNFRPVGLHVKEPVAQLFGFGRRHRHSLRTPAAVAAVAVAAVVGVVTGGLGG